MINLKVHHPARNPRMMIKGAKDDDKTSKDDDKASKDDGNNRDDGKQGKHMFLSVQQQFLYQQFFG